jgi:hypothetical protein
MSNQLRPGESMADGESRTSLPSNQFQLLYDNGDLCLRRTGQTENRWHTGTAFVVGRVTMGLDGDLVLSSADGTPVWSTRTGHHDNAGAYLEVQDDGNLVIYRQDRSVVWASGTHGNSAHSAFQASSHGLLFANAFPHTPGIHRQVEQFSVDLGDAGNGMCGGMVYTALDLFLAGTPRPGAAAAPSEGPLFDYIGDRLVDSFALPAGFLRYSHLMHPDTSVQERVRTMNEAFEQVRTSLNSAAAQPVPLGLVTIESPDILKLGKNHQVLAVGYETIGDHIRIHVYDPNYPLDDTITVEYDYQAQPAMGGTARLCQARTAVKTIYSFFVPPYTPRRPPGDLNVLTPSAPPLTLENGSSHPQQVRIFRGDDAVRVMALTAGEFTVAPHSTEQFVLPSGVTEVAVVSNGRHVGNFRAGVRVLITDDRVRLINATGRPILARLYKADDRLRWGELPGGRVNIDVGREQFYTIPSDVRRVSVVVDGSQEQLAESGDHIRIT